MIWVYQNKVGMPRVAAIEHPFGRPYGDVGDAETCEPSAKFGQIGPMIQERVPGSERRRNSWARRNRQRRQSATFDGRPDGASRRKRRSGS
jgi:hypothetical protein